MLTQKGIDSFKKNSRIDLTMPKAEPEKEISKKSQLGQSLIRSGKETIEYSPEEGNIVISNPIENNFDASK